MSIDKSNYIAKGTYGCVIKPSFDCNNNKKITNSVAKLFIFKEDWKKEIQENNIIKNLDSTNKFTIKMLNYCEISSDFLNKNVNNINKCDKNNKEIIYQIIYEDGGIDLRKLFQDIPNNFDYNNFLNKLKEIFQGLIILKNNNLCHRDIKLDNLLYNKNNNKISLIDFGLMVNFDDIYNYDNFNIYLYNNSYYYPNELKIYSLIKLNKTLSFENLTYNSDNLINYWGARKQLVLSGLVVTLGLIIATIYPNLLVSSIGFMLVGFGVSSVIPTIYGTVGKTTEPSQVSIALASVSSVGFFGFLIGPPIIGFLSQAIGLRWAFLTVSSLGIITALRANQLKKYL